MPHHKAQILQFLCHAGAAIAAQRQGELFANVREDYHIFALTLAERTIAVGPIPSRADIHDLAQPLDREHARVLCNESKPHLLRSAKNWVAFVGETPHWGLS